MRRCIAALCVVVVALLPACSRNKPPNSLFDAAFTLDTSGHLVQMALTGTFYPGADDVTYTFAFSGYGSKATVHAP